LNYIKSLDNKFRKSICNKNSAHFDNLIDCYESVKKDLKRFDENQDYVK